MSEEQKVAFVWQFTCTFAPLILIWCAARAWKWWIHTKRRHQE